MSDEATDFLLLRGPISSSGMWSLLFFPLHHHHIPSFASFPLLSKSL